MSYSSQDLDLSIFAREPDFTQDPDLWPEAAPLAGDWYCPADPVTRGCDLKLPPAPEFEEPGSSFKGSAAYDFYGQHHCPDEFSKGMVDAERLPEIPDFFKGLGETMPDVGQPQRTHTSLLDADYRAKTSEEISGSLPAGQFVESHIPPCRPNDSFFRLAMTTMYALSSRPYEIGNALLTFLATQVISNILKVNHDKFAIKAEVFVGNVMCVMKIRVYDEGEGTYATEFQRRSGDTRAFNSAYQQAKKFIWPHLAESGTASMPDAGPMFLPFPRQLLKASAEDGDVADLQGGFQPLFDMAGQAELPELQAESASSLADIAQDDEQGVLLCTSENFLEVRKLLQSDRTDVAYPTACALRSLAERPEASQVFAGDGMLPVILEKLRSKETCTLVQQKLAQVLIAAIPLCAVSLTAKVAEDMMEALQGAIQVCGDTAPARKDLQEAHQALASTLVQ